MKFNFTKNQCIGLTGCLYAVVSVFLPLITVSLLGFSKSISYIEGDGIFVIVLAVIEAVMIYFNKKPIYTMIPAAGIAILVIVLIANKAGMATEYGSMASFSFGFYLLVAALAAMVTGPILQIKEGK